jgi:hypothetical protein
LRWCCGCYAIPMAEPFHRVARIAVIVVGVLIVTLLLL